MTGYCEFKVRDHTVPAEVALKAQDVARVHIDGRERGTLDTKLPANTGSGCTHLVLVLREWLDHTGPWDEGRVHADLVVEQPQVEAEHFFQGESTGLLDQASQPPGRLVEFLQLRLLLAENKWRLTNTVGLAKLLDPFDQLVQHLKVLVPGYRIFVLQVLGTLQHATKLV